MNEYTHAAAGDSTQVKIACYISTFQTQDKQHYSAARCEGKCHCTIASLDSLPLHPL